MWQPIMHCTQRHAASKRKLPLLHKATLSRRTMPLHVQLSSAQQWQIDDIGMPELAKLLHKV
jgi:hypothetical protein